MAEWITLEEAAEMIGVRKGTLSMWRVRKRFPFRSKGRGRGLLVSRASVEEWQAAGGRAGVRRGRPPKAAAGAAEPRRPGRPGRPPKATQTSFRTQADLAAIQEFVASLKAGKNVRVVPEKNGYVLTLEA